MPRPALLTRMSTWAPSSSMRAASRSRSSGTARSVPTATACFVAAQLRTQLLQPVLPAGGDDDAVAAGHELTGELFADAGGCAGDHGDRTCRRRWKCHVARAYSHAEVRALNGRNGIRWSAHFDSRRGLAAKDVEQEFARRTAESSRRFACSSHLPLVGSGPLNLEPAAVQPPA